MRFRIGLARGPYYFRLAVIAACLVGSAGPAMSYDPILDQKVKYHQSRVNWKIKEGQDKIRKSRERMQSEREQRSSYGSSSGSGSSSHSSSSSNSRTPGVSASRCLQTFMTAASRATSLDQLHPYAIRTTREYWGRLNASDKQKVLMGLKKWAYHGRVISEDCKPAVATVRLQAPGVKGAHLWVEDGVWKFSDVIKQ
ncbi:MAG: hypothetical protein AB7W16_09080 [Candidatus Obscuribacterales bacterium]